MYCPGKNSETTFMLNRIWKLNCHSSVIIEDLEKKAWTHTLNVFMPLDY